MNDDWLNVLIKHSGCHVNSYHSMQASIENVLNSVHIGVPGGLSDATLNNLTLLPNYIVLMVVYGKCTFLLPLFCSLLGCVCH